MVNHIQESPYSKKIKSRSNRAFSSIADEATSLPVTRRTKLSIQLGDDDLTSKLQSVLSPKERHPGSISARNFTSKFKNRTPSSETIKLYNDRNKNITKIEEERQELMIMYNELQIELKDLLTLNKIKDRREQKIEILKKKIVQLAEEKSVAQSKINGFEVISKDFTQLIERGSLNSDERTRLIGQIQKIVGISEVKIKERSIPPPFMNSNEEMTADLWNLYRRYYIFFNNSKLFG